LQGKSVERLISKKPGSPINIHLLLYPPFNLFTLQLFNFLYLPITDHCLLQIEKGDRQIITFRQSRCIGHGEFSACLPGYPQ